MLFRFPFPCFALTSWDTHLLLRHFHTHALQAQALSPLHVLSFPKFFLTLTFWFWSGFWEESGWVLLI